MGTCLTTTTKDVTYLADEIQEHSSNTTQSTTQSAAIQPEVKTDSRYKLNDLRSLEGVAGLWSEKLKTQCLPNNQPRKSMPMMGNNHSNRINRFSPIAISTYYFIHSPSAKNQPNLLKSHSSPQYVSQRTETTTEPITTKTPIKTPSRQSRRISNLLLDQTTIDENKEDDNIFQMIDHISSNRTSMHSYSAPQGLPPLQMMPAMIPVFTNSNSNYSMNSPEYYTPVNPTPVPVPVTGNDIDNGLNGITGVHLNIAPCATEELKYDPTLIQMTMTYSDQNVFTLDIDNDMQLNDNDFMEYDMNTNALNNLNNIGVGASGVVIKAFHFSSCKMVAIKSCRSMGLQEINSFQKEAKIYKLFEDSKYIIDIIGFGKCNKSDINGVIMALEYMDLGSVASLKINETIGDIKKRELIVGYIIYNVLLALNDFHKKLYVHNDIKPANILTNKYGEIKLSDFGTALQLPNKNAFLHKNNGTQKFQSPEKTMMKVKYNCKTDIWSLGITCYELLFGPNKQQVNSDNMINMYARKPPILNTNEHNLSINCCNFINKCLTMNQFDRPTSNELLSHEWFTQNIKINILKDKWPWLINSSQSSDDLLSKHNEDLLFMISALIIYYSTKKFNDKNNGAIHGLHRRVSVKTDDKNVTTYSDEQRIENVAKYALCSKDTVMDRIKVTVSYIKSQLNKVEMKM